MNYEFLARLSKVIHDLINPGNSGLQFCRNATGKRSQAQFIIAQKVQRQATLPAGNRWDKQLLATRRHTGAAPVVAHCLSVVEEAAFVTQLGAWRPGSAASG